MPLQILSTPGDETGREISRSIERALPGASVEVSAGGAGHFEVRVTSEAFAGKSRVAQQRLVYQAIAHLMQGDTAPVHAIDRMETRVP